MNIAKHLLCSLGLVLAASSAHAAEPMDKLIRDNIAVATRQYSFMLEQIRDKKGLPRTFEKGELKMAEAPDWTIGFFPGSLWYLAEATGDPKWRSAAQRYTLLTAPAKFDKSHHDVGFMLYSSYGNGLRLGGGDATYRDVLLAGATTLVTRYNPKVRSIQSWNARPNQTWIYPVIIDNLMNLELLTWASRASGDPYYREVAIAHADTTLRNHFRPDASSFHVVDYDPLDGRVRQQVTRQGFSDSSAWARGQAWAVYGYTMMYRETRKPEYLQQAQKVAAFIMNHPRLPADKVPYWDFDAPGIPNEPRDASSAAIISSALLELSDYVEPAQARRYTEFAEQQLRSLSSPAYRAAPGENGGFLLKHSTGSKPAGNEVDVPLNYADYYFLEALLRYKAKLSKPN